jgi:phage-related protein
MSLSLGSLYVSLTANASGLVKGFSDATKAAERVAKDMKRVSGEVAQAAGVMSALGIAAVKLASSVDGPTKNAMDGLEQSTKLLAVQVADMLLPAVKQLTSMFKAAASVVAGLSPEVKAQVAHFAVMAVEVAAAAKAFSIFAGMAGSVFSILRAGLSLVASLGSGPMMGIIAAVGSVIAVVVLLHRAWRKNWGGIQDATKDVLEWLHSAFSQLGDFFGKVWNVAIDGAAHFVEAILKAVDVLQEVTGKKLVDTGGLREGFSGLWADLKSGAFFADAFKFGKSVGTEMLDGLKEELGLIQKELGLDKLLSGGSGKTIALGRGMGAPKVAGPAISGAVGPQFEGINAGAAWLHEMDKLAKDTADRNAALELARTQEMNVRLAIASDLEKQKRIAGAIQQGTTGKLTGADRARAESMMDGTKKDAVSADSWGAAMSTLEAGLQGSLNAGVVLETWGKRMSGIVGSAGQQILGAVGDLVNSIVQGAQQGGVWGAIVAAILEVVKQAKSAFDFLGTAMNFMKRLGQMIEPLVKPIFDALTNVLGIVAEILLPVFQALQPLFNAIAKLIKNLSPILYAIGNLLEAIGPILEVIGNIVGDIVDGLKPIFDLIAGVIKVIATVILGIIIGLNEVAAAFGDEKAKAESNRLKGIIDRMWDPTQDVGARADAAGNSIRNMGDASDSATATIQKVAESLTNVPTGYKLALARFNADLSVGAGPSAALAGAGGTTINGDVYVTSSATTVDQLALDAKKEAARERGQQRGNPSRPRGTGGRD